MSVRKKDGQCTTSNLSDTEDEFHVVLIWQSHNGIRSSHSHRCSNVMSSLLKFIELMESENKSHLII